MLTVRRLRFGLLALGAGVVALVPWLVPPYTSFELAYVGAYAVAILGLVILTGQNGQISLGHGAFLAAGGYVVAIAAQRLGIAYWISIPLTRELFTTDENVITKSPVALAVAGKS